MRWGNLERVESELRRDLDSRQLVIELLTLLNEQVVEIDVSGEISAKMQ